MNIADADPNPHARDRQTARLVTKISLLLVATLTIMAGATISPALPGIQDHFSGTPNAAMLTRLLLTLPGLFVAFAAHFVGGIADRFGRIRLLIVSMILYGCSGSSGLIANSLITLLVGRALLGVAVAGIMTVSTVLVGDYFKGAERNHFMGVQMAFTGAGGFIFLTAGGYLADISWRAPFAIYAFALVILPLPVIFLQDKPYTSGGGEIADPGVHTSTLRIGIICLTGIISSILFYITPTQLPFLIRESGFPLPSTAGIAIGALAISQTILALNFGRLRSLFSAGTLFALGFSALAAGFVAIAQSKLFALILLGTSMSGAGLGLVMPGMMTAALALAPPRRRGRVTAALTGSVFFGQFISPFCSQPFVDSFGLPTTFAIFGAFALIWGFVSWIIWRRFYGPY
jgi:MFS family permease